MKVYKCAGTRDNKEALCIVTAPDVVDLHDIITRAAEVLFVVEEVTLIAKSARVSLSRSRSGLLSQTEKPFSIDSESLKAKIRADWWRTEMRERLAKVETPAADKPVPPADKPVPPALIRRAEGEV